MSRPPRLHFCYCLCAALSFYCRRPCFAQFVPPSGGDPRTVACLKGPANGAGIDPVDAFEKAKQVASIEGDGVLGIGNWGHTEEALA